MTDVLEMFNPVRVQIELLLSAGEQQPIVIQLVMLDAHREAVCDIVDGIRVIVRDDMSGLDKAKLTAANATLVLVC